MRSDIGSHKTCSARIGSLARQCTLLLGRWVIKGVIERRLYSARLIGSHETAAETPQSWLTPKETTIFLLAFKLPLASGFELFFWPFPLSRHKTEKSERETQLSKDFLGRPAYGDGTYE